MMTKRLVTGLVLSLAWIATGVLASEIGSKWVAPMPSPGLSPAEVMEIQVEALQYVDRPTRDAGIATTFRFASPGNREATGPVERFALIVKGPAFSPLMKHRIAGYDPIMVKGDHAARRVTIVAADGQVVEYEFQLSKDAKSGCWFTDGVIPLPAGGKIDPGKVARIMQTLPGSLSE